MNDWDDWFANHEKAAEVYPLRIRQMWLRHGKSENKCGKCAHFLRVQSARYIASAARQR